MTTATISRHRCIDCAALPPRPADYTPATHNHEDYQPAAPRKTTGGPRSQRCTTHRRRYEAQMKASRSAARTRRVYGVGREEGEQLWAFQGSRCACGRTPRLRKPEMDHSHDCCPAGESCGNCVRGWLDSQCNHEIVGRLEALHDSATHLARCPHPSRSHCAAAALLRLASHLLDPPLARMRRGESAPYELDMDTVRALLGGAREEEMSMTPDEIAAACGGCAGSKVVGTYDALTRAVGEQDCPDCGGSGLHEVAS